MRSIGNFLWFVLGGAVSGCLWWLIGLLAYASIIGIPWGRACFVLGQFSFFPFGKEAISRKELTTRDDIGNGLLGFLGNVLWFLCGGLQLALVHLCLALCCFITLIGIPFGVQHLKLAGLALAPIGKTIVTTEVAEVARWTSAKATIASMRTSA